MHYSAATSWNNAAAMVKLNPQPFGIGVGFGEWESSSLGLLVPQGRQTTYLLYGDISTDTYVSLLVQLGLSRTVTSRKMTVKIKDHDTGEWIIRNCYVGYPQGRKRMAKWEGVQFPLTGLRTLT